MHQLLFKALKEGATIGCLNALICKSLDIRRAPGANTIAVIALLGWQNSRQDKLPYYQPWDLEQQDNFFDMANMPTAWRFMTAHFAAGVSDTVTKSMLNIF